MRKILFVLLSVFLLTACSGKSEGYSYDESKVLDAAAMKNAFADSSNHKGESVIFKGQIFNEFSEGEDKVYFQLHQDVENYSDSIAFQVPDSLDVTLKSDDFVTVKGYILGELVFENLLGGKVGSPIVYATDIQVGSYSDIIAAPIKTIEVGKSITQNDFSITVDKIEFSDYDTRLFVSAENNNANKVSFYTFNMTLVIDGKNYKEDSNYFANYDEVDSELQPGTKTDGIVAFTKIDPTNLGDIKLVIDSPYSDDWEIEFTDYIFEFSE